MLQPVGKFNNIPKELLPELPQSQDGNPVIVKFKCIETHFDPIADKGKPINVYPRDLPIPKLSRFKNPKNPSEWFDIGMVSSVDKNGNPEVSEDFRKLFHWDFAKNNGYYTITIGYSPMTDALYQYFMLASFVSGNAVEDEYKNKTEKVILEYIDEQAIAKKELAEQDLKWKAMGVAANLKDEQLKDMAFILGFGHLTDDIIIRQKVRAMSEKDPALFLARVEDESAPYMARIAQALQLNAVVLEGNSLIWNDASKREIMKVANTTPEGIQKEYAEFAQSPEGKKIDQVLSGDLKKKRVKA